MEELNITINTRTPIWTGGLVSEEMTRIHESGILGSLRWWYEIIIRGLGGKACDLNNHKCEFSGEKLMTYNRACNTGKSWWEALDEVGICEACKIFGTTGWQRRFRLNIQNDQTQLAWSPPPDILNVRPPDRSRGWYLPPGRMGTFTVRIIGEEKVLKQLAALFVFLEKWGNIGAKPQLGYGVFEIKNKEEITRRLNGWKWQILGTKNTHDKLPDLRRFGFFRFQFQPEKPGWWTKVPGMERIAAQVQPIVRNYSVVPVAPSLKNEWRFHQWDGNREDEKLMFGTLKWHSENKIKRLRSKIVVSWAYKHENIWEAQGWVWMPKKSIASKVWRVLTDKSGWKNVIKVNGILSTDHPDGWFEKNIYEVCNFLNRREND